ncbi:MAG: NAD kinase [Bacteroidales bacterium]|jgi:NAD+ kinase|nr:NAD kinase [Bacteroidales bacterium]
MNRSIAIFGKILNERNAGLIGNIISILKAHSVEIYLHQQLYEFLQPSPAAIAQVSGTFSSHADMPQGVSYFFSVGGDGSFLESVNYVRNSGIPIVGINSGRLGFLATIAEQDLQQSIESLLAGNLPTEERTLLYVGSNMDLGDFPYALNDIVIQKKSGLLTVHVWCNDEFLNSYWADGLIIGTPTGSSAYSMSVGGPIVAPDARNFIISPIAPHNLTVRPLVIPDNSVLKLKTESRSNSFSLSMDSRSYDCSSDIELEVKRAEYRIKTVKPFSFYATLRNKLLWGVDKRN